MEIVLIGVTQVIKSRGDQYQIENKGIGSELLLLRQHTTDRAYDNDILVLERMN